MRNPIARRIVAALAALAFAAPLAAQTELPPPPEPTAGGDAEPAGEPTPLADIPVIESLEPEIESAREQGARVEAYRRNGQVYMVRITPRVGPPYYLLDYNGDGVLDARQGELERGVVVPSWVIFSW